MCNFFTAGQFFLSSGSEMVLAILLSNEAHLGCCIAHLQDAACLIFGHSIAYLQGVAYLTQIVESLFRATKLVPCQVKRWSSFRMQPSTFRIWCSFFRVLHSSCRMLCTCSVLKGVWYEIFDFRIFMNQCPPGPQVFHWSLFEFFRKFAEIFANECLSPESVTPVISCSAEATTSAKNFCRWQEGGGKLPSIGESWRGKSVISSAAEVSQGRRWCHWNYHEKLHP